MISFKSTKMLVQIADLRLCALYPEPFCLRPCDGFLPGEQHHSDISSSLITMLFSYQDNTNGNQAIYHLNVIAIFGR